jgi:hypothetical protein
VLEFSLNDAADAPFASPERRGYEQLLRNLLRVKVEDGNDLQMAATTVRELDRFYVRLVECATQSGEDRYDLYQRLVSL